MVCLSNLSAKPMKLCISALRQASKSPEALVNSKMKRGLHTPIHSGGVSRASGLQLLMAPISTWSIGIPMVLLLRQLTTSALLNCLSIRALLLNPPTTRTLVIAPMWQIFNSQEVSKDLNTSSQLEVAIKVYSNGNIIRLKRKRAVIPILKLLNKRMYLKRI